MTGQIKISPSSGIVNSFKELVVKHFEHKNTTDDDKSPNEPTIDEQLKKEKSWVACLIVLQGAQTGHRILLNKDEVTIGRSKDVDVRLEQHKVSRMHAVIQRLNEQQFVLLDKDSTNGTFINSKNIRRALLKNQDLITIGDYNLKFISSDSPEQSYYEELYRQVQMDNVLPVYNKHFFLSKLEEEINLCNRYHIDLSLILFDVDYFNRLNDTYGHLAGDAALVQLADIVKKRIRETDILCRYGDEKFAIILPHVNQEQAHMLAEHIRILVTKKAVEYKDKAIEMTISLGISSCSSGSKTPCTKDLLITQADQALYLAKQSGRNKVVLSDSTL